MIATMSACLCEVTLPGEAEVIAAGGRAGAGFYRRCGGEQGESVCVCFSWVHEALKVDDNLTLGTLFM